VLGRSGSAIHVDLHDASEEFASVAFSDVTSLTARIGARLAKTWKQDEFQPNENRGWLRLSIWHEFEGDPQTAFASDAGTRAFRPTSPQARF